MSDWDFFVQYTRVGLKAGAVVIAIGLLVLVVFWVFSKDRA